jgi:hypothetical protein
MEDQDEASFRQDFNAIHAPEETLIRYRKFRSDLDKAAKKSAKPDTCCICGKENPKFCNSHTIPQYCLREIAVEGKLLTNAALVGGNLLDTEVGIAQALTFKRICRKCDTEFFKLYETPETLLQEPSSQVMGQIAAKNLLREISKAKQELGSQKVLGDKSPAMYDAMMDVRSIDVAEDEKALQTALRVGGSAKPSNVYSILYYKVLPYVVPFAFQQRVCLISDFEGSVINNVYNRNPKYKMEPLDVCVLPSKGNTVVLLFASSRAKRYRAFARQLRLLADDEALEAIVKIIFTYSEDVLISKHLSESVLEDASLKQLARMNSCYIMLFHSLKGDAANAIHAAIDDYSISALPDVPNLLSEQYSLER